MEPRPKMKAVRKNHESSESALDFSAVHVRDSGVEGRGTYAARDINAGEFVLPLTGALVPTSVVDAPDYDRMALQIDDGWWLEERGFADDFINHSCDPNLKFSEQGNSFVALRSIKKGEELFFDYATSVYDGGWSVVCQCNSENCRGTIMGYQDLNSDIQIRLLENCLPFIRKKHG